MGSQSGGSSWGPRNECSRPESTCSGDSSFGGLHPRSYISTESVTQEEGPTCGEQGKRTTTSNRQVMEWKTKEPILSTRYGVSLLRIKESQQSVSRT